MSCIQEAFLKIKEITPWCMVGGRDFNESDSSKTDNKKGENWSENFFVLLSIKALNKKLARGQQL